MTGTTPTGPTGESPERREDRPAAAEPPEESRSGSPVGHPEGGRGTLGPQEVEQGQWDEPPEGRGPSLAEPHPDQE